MDGDLLSYASEDVVVTCEILLQRRRRERDVVERFSAGVWCPIEGLGVM